MIREIADNLKIGSEERVEATRIGMRNRKGMEVQEVRLLYTLLY